MRSKTDPDEAYCRLCLGRQETCQYFVDAMTDESQIRHKIVKIFNFSLDGSNFSPFICLSCHDWVESTSDFIDTVLDNQEKLRNLSVKEDSDVIKHENDPQSMCFESFQVSVKLEEVEEEPQSLPFTCDICSETFSSKGSIISHMIKHTTTNFTCKCCQKSFQTSSGLRRHRKNQHPIEKNEIVIEKEDPVFICPHCKVFLPHKYAFIRHVEAHKPDEEKHFVCETCSKRFYREKYLKWHINQSHNKKIKEKSSCEQCNKEFVSKPALQSHIRRIHAPDRLPCVCETCGRQCVSKMGLAEHIRFTHANKLSKCDICGAVVKYISSHRRRHLSMGVKCKFCEKVCTDVKALRNHMKIHDDSKPFECSVCGEAFKRKNALLDHQSQHTGVPRHFCLYCDRTFNNSGNKFKHIKQAHPVEHKKATEEQRILREKRTQEGQNF